MSPRLQNQADLVFCVMESLYSTMTRRQAFAKNRHKKFAIESSAVQMAALPAAAHTARARQIDPTIMGGFGSMLTELTIAKSQQGC